MRFAQLIALVGLVYGSGAWAIDEAAVYQQIRLLQAQPDPAQRSWLEEMSRYQSTALTDLRESREPMLVPTYPVAAAAKAALQALDVEQMVARLQQAAAPELPLRFDRTLTKAWALWIQDAPTLPAVVQTSGPAYNWPETLLHSIAAHPSADASWTQALLRQATSGASLRWIDTQLAVLDAKSLQIAEANPALAEHAWGEWGRRASTDQALAIEHLTKTFTTAPGTPGLAAGLARWPGSSALWGDARKQQLLSPAHQQLRELTELRRTLIPASEVAP